MYSEILENSIEVYGGFDSLLVDELDCAVICYQAFPYYFEAIDVFKTMVFG